MLKKNSGISLIAFCIIAACLATINYSSFPGNILSWDVFGYYLYLPMTFIYDNLGLQNIDLVNTIIEKYQNTAPLYQAYKTETGFWVMRYSAGMAVLYAPFFFIGHLLAHFSSYPADGFSMPYQVAIFTGGIIYSIAGFYFLRRVLLRFFTDKTVAISLMAIYFGSNYFMHTTFHGTNAMSHNYLFTLYAVILWLNIKWHEKFQLKHALLMALACGIIILSRPSEVICLFIPLFWGLGHSYTLKEKWQLFWQQRFQLFLFFVTLMIVALPQFLYWKIITGHFLFNSYGDNPAEGFEFRHPFVLEVLFSFRKGWFIYTPLMLFATAGFYQVWKQKQAFWLPVILFFIFNTYIISSWSCWWYAESFGQRALIQSYPIMLFPLASLIEHFTKNGRKINSVIAIAAISILIFLNIFQTNQFLKGILHPSRMTKAAYISIFGKTERPPQLDNLLMIDRNSPDAAIIDSTKYIKTKEWVETFDNNPGCFKDSIETSNCRGKLDSVMIYSVNLKKSFADLTQKDHAKLRLSLQIYSAADSKSNPGALVAVFENKKGSWAYASAATENMEVPAGRWTKISMDYLTPVVRNTLRDTLKVYYWHRGKMPVLIDDMKLEVWEQKD